MFAGGVLLVDFADEGVGCLDEEGVCGGDHDGSVLVVGGVPLDDAGGLGEVVGVGEGVLAEGFEVGLGGDVHEFGEVGEVGGEALVFGVGGAGVGGLEALFELGAPGGGVGLAANFAGL
ncbi:MAG: hypothetical protein CMF28_06095 [Kiritimatiellaceae bacterium]|nr:hypothetical protein [Kiritimatiellaceae bacterium]